jgi:hypothetical protein
MAVEQARDCRDSHELRRPSGQSLMPVLSAKPSGRVAAATSDSHAPAKRLGPDRRSICGEEPRTEHCWAWPMAPESGGRQDTIAVVRRAARRSTGYACVHGSRRPRLVCARRPPDNVTANPVAAVQARMAFWARGSTLNAQTSQVVVAPTHRLVKVSTVMVVAAAVVKAR